MARQLWLLRHAEAEPHGVRVDFDRRLTARGKQQSRVAGIAMARLQASFDAVLFSPRVRARQTAEIAAEALGQEASSVLSAHPPLAGGFDGAQALEAVDSVAGEEQRVLLVGHEPDLSNVVAELTGCRVVLKKAGLAVVRLEAAGGELAVLVRPRELALIAGIPAGGD